MGEKFKARLTRRLSCSCQGLGGSKETSVECINTREVLQGRRLLNLMVFFRASSQKKHQFMSIKKEECGINLPFEGLSELMACSENLYQLLYVSGSCKLMPSNEPLYQDE